MIKKIFWFCAATAAFVVAEAAVCNCAEKHPRVKNVVDRQAKKDGQGFFRRLPRSRWRGSLRSGYGSRVRRCACNAAKFFAPHCG